MGRRPQAVTGWKVAGYVAYERPPEEGSTHVEWQGDAVVVGAGTAGCAAAAYAIGRRSRHLERRQSEEGLRTWEDEGGNLSPSEAQAGARSAAGS